MLFLRRLKQGKTMTDQKWSGKTHGWGLGIKIFLALIKFFGFTPAYILLIPVCFVHTIINSKARKAVKQFRKHLGLSTTFFDCYAHFFSFSITLVHKAGFLISRNKEIKYLTQNQNYIENVVKTGKGVILLSAHIGNFELAGEILSERIDAKLNILMVERDGEKMKKIYESINKNRKVNIISPDGEALETALKIKNALQSGEIVTALGDRYIDGNVVEIEFLGEKAKFPRGIFEIAAMTQTPIIPVFTTRRNINVYEFRAGEPINILFLERKKREEFIFSAIRNFVNQIAEQAKKTPLQWYNYYCFWD
jgi:predicted LPLAT superfamily acyltransferase